MDRYPVLWFASAALSVVCVIAVFAGFMTFIVGVSPGNADTFRVASLVVQKSLLMGGGAAVMISGLIGLILAGGVRVLIAIEDRLAKSISTVNDAGQSPVPTGPFAAENKG